MYLKSIAAIFAAARALVRDRRALLLMLATYSALLATSYLFISTREATISQLVLTLAVVIAAPALFFVLQSLTVSYTNGLTDRKKIAGDSLKLILASLPAIALTVLALYALSKLQNHPTLATTLRYLVVALVAPLLTIQLWITTIDSGLRALITNLRRILTRTLAPQSVFVYACGFLIFAVAPYLLLHKAVPLQRPWLEFSVLVLRLGLSAVLILIGWVTTVGAISILSRQNSKPLLCLLFVLFACNCSYATTSRSSHFRLVHPQTLADRDAEHILQLLETNRSELLRRVSSSGIEVRFPELEIILNESTGNFVGRTGMPAWAAAATKRNQIELQPFKLLKQRGILETTLRHELVHVLIDSLGKGQTPRWLSEGMALYVAGEGRMLAHNGQTNSMPVKIVEQALASAKSAGEMMSAYAAAYSLVKELIRVEGEDKVWKRLIRV